MGTAPGWRSGLGWLLLLWLLSTLGFGWLLRSLAVLVALLVLVPAIAVVAGQWWWRQNTIADACPMCQGEFTALRSTSVNCPHCGEALTVVDRRFTRYTPPGTIEVEVQTIE
ncbi:MAG: hypothetical protein HC918_01145 [Oscillatoriales cyanobacterium SM2_1_8]|nr:hypothetical protein [Oscillatoriales cyanobacterium SM2_1_8]